MKLYLSFNIGKSWGNCTIMDFYGFALIMMFLLILGWVSIILFPIAVALCSFIYITHY